MENKYGEWIKCSDRLPKDGTLVLFLDKYRYPRIGYYDAPDRVRETGSFLHLSDMEYWTPMPNLPPKRPRRIVLEIECGEERCEKCEMLNSDCCNVFGYGLSRLGAGIYLRHPECLAVEIKEAGDG